MCHDGRIKSLELHLFALSSGFVNYHREVKLHFYVTLEGTSQQKH